MKLQLLNLLYETEIAESATARERVVWEKMKIDLRLEEFKKGLDRFDEQSHGTDGGNH